MTAIKHTLQRDVFLPNDERLMGLVHVTQAGKKKKGSKMSFLCATLATGVEGSGHVRVYLVKKADRGEVYKKKLTWMLRELKQIDGKDKMKETVEFDLVFEKVFKWNASSFEDKEAFITCLWKLSQRYLVGKPEFINVPSRWLEEIIRPSSHSASQEEGSAMDEDYQALTSKEETDLEMLMSDTTTAISDAENFADYLSKQLSILDGANIHSIMGSEDQVLNLMRLLDEGIQKAEVIETKLDSYDKILQAVKEQMEVMKDKDQLINVRNTNHEKLLSELESLVNQLDLDAKYVKSLKDGDLSAPNGILDCTAAAYQLQRCVRADIHDALLNMSAVKEQQKKFAMYSSDFSKRLAHHLNNLFIHQANESGETLSRYASELRLPQHHSSHRDLTPYTDLMMWLKNSDPVSFKQLAKVYTENLSKLYTREIQEFLDTAKQAMTGKGDRVKMNLSTSSGIGKMSGSSGSLNKPVDRSRSGSMQSVESIVIHGSETDLAIRHLFDQVFDKVLSELEPVCLAEQDFCCKFFHLLSDVQAAPIQDDVEDETIDTGEIWMKQKPKITVEEYIVVNLGEGLTQKRPSMQLRQINEEVRAMLTELFPTMEDELESFISFADKQDGFNSMYMLVRMSQHVTNTQDTGSFLSVTFASSLVKIKRHFDKFIQMQIKAVEENKVSRKTKCGIISFVHNFEEFATQAENIFRGSERHTDLDKAYNRLVRTIFDNINRISEDHPKTPREVIMMENYHHMFSILSHLKLPCLETDKKEAKQIYQDCLNAYTKDRLGRPLEKLHTFIEGVKSRLNQGIKPEEVGYQLAFSKQELRKVIKEYPGKEVKKSLDHLYKKVEKHLSEEENLLQVVWVSMQNEFIKQYKHYEELVNKCYPDSNITLDFTIDDVLQFFTNIAQSH